MLCRTAGVKSLTLGGSLAGVLGCSVVVQRETSECTVWSKSGDIKRLSWGVGGCLGIFRRTIVLVSRLTSSKSQAEKLI